MDVVQLITYSIKFEDLVLTFDQLENYVSVEIETFFQSNNNSLKYYPEIPQADVSSIFDSQNRLIYDELN